MKKIQDILNNSQEELWDTDFRDIVMDFSNNYGGTGDKINTNVFQINFPGTSDWFYFFSIPDKDLKTYKRNLDKYPVYFVDFYEGVEWRSSNIKTLLSEFLDETKLEELSSKTIKQSIPILSNDNKKS